jgi:hypothetical protein
LNGHCKCKSGNKVVSWSEQTIDDWFFEHEIRAIYEPQIPADSEFLLPDWLLLPQCGIDKPIIVEYWGLLRKENRAEWVKERLPRYLDKKKSKEDIYTDLDAYYYLSILPEHMEDLDNYLPQELEKFGWVIPESEPEITVDIRKAGHWTFRVYKKQT